MFHKSLKEIFWFQIGNTLTEFAGDTTELRKQ